MSKGVRIGDLLQCLGAFSTRVVLNEGRSTPNAIKRGVRPNTSNGGGAATTAVNLSGRPIRPDESSPALVQVLGHSSFKADLPFVHHRESVATGFNCQANGAGARMLSRLAWVQPFTEPLYVHKAIRGVTQCHTTALPQEGVCETRDSRYCRGDVHAPARVSNKPRCLGDRTI